MYSNRKSSKNITENNLLDFDDFSPHEPTTTTNQSSSKSQKEHNIHDEDIINHEGTLQSGSNGISWTDNYVVKNIPILILLSIKLLTQHITGFLVIIGCLLASRAANDRVKLFDRRCVEGRAMLIAEALLIILVLAFDKYLLYKLIMAEDGGANVLVLVPVTGIYSANILNIFWLIIVSQFFLHLVEISLKAVFSAIFMIPFNRRGYFYSLIKNSLTFYRWILPMPQICAYLWSSSKESNPLAPGNIDNPSSFSAHSWFSFMFDIILITIYLAFKLYGIKEYAINFYKSMLLIFNPLNIGEYVKNDQSILQTKVCPISHLPFNFNKYGEKPINITNLSNQTFVVSEQGLYCWLNLQSEMDMAPQQSSSSLKSQSDNQNSSSDSKSNGTSNSKNNDNNSSTSAFLCPITMEPLRLSSSANNSSSHTEAKSYLSSADTSYHVFLM